MENDADFDATETIDPHACPGCGCELGQGLTLGCSHPAGCGFWRSYDPENDTANPPGVGLLAEVRFGL